MVERFYLVCKVRHNPLTDLIGFFCDQWFQILLYPFIELEFPKVGPPIPARSQRKPTQGDSFVQVQWERTSYRIHCAVYC